MIKARSNIDIHKQTTKIAYPAAGLKLFGASAVYSPLKSHICFAVRSVLNLSDRPRYSVEFVPTEFVSGFVMYRILYWVGSN
jgi:hypothetical protein